MNDPHGFRIADFAENVLKELSDNLVENREMIVDLAKKLVVAELEAILSTEVRFRHGNEMIRREAILDVIDNFSIPNNFSI
jgi:hypothetical protein